MSRLTFSMIHLTFSWVTSPHSLLDEVHGVEGLLLLAPELGHKVDPDHLREALGDRRLLVFGPESQWQAARMSYEAEEFDRGARCLVGVDNMFTGGGTPIWILGPNSIEKHIALVLA